MIVKSTEPIETIDEAAKKKLKECIEAGTINDVIVVTQETENVTNKSKVLAWSKDVTSQAPTYNIALVNCKTKALSVLIING